MSDSESAAPAAIVSGGTYGIGRGVAVHLAERGYRVVAFGLDEPQPGSAAQHGSAGTAAELEQRGVRADVVEADVANAADVERVVSLALGRYGRIDALVNCAAI